MCVRRRVNDRNVLAMVVTLAFFVVVARVDLARDITDVIAAITAQREIDLDAICLEPAQPDAQSFHKRVFDRLAERGRDLSSLLVKAHA